jgi:hypothetical protein
MSVSKKKSSVDHMVAILEKYKRPMNLIEVVEKIQKLDPYALSGNTPRKSLYSVVYRREKRRSEKGEKALFRTVEVNNELFFTLNK